MFFLLVVATHAEDPFDQGYFPVGESFNMFNKNTNIKTKKNVPARFYYGLELDLSTVPLIVARASQ